MRVLAVLFACWGVGWGAGGPPPPSVWIALTTHFNGSGDGRWQTQVELDQGQREGEDTPWRTELQQRADHPCDGDPAIRTTFILSVPAGNQQHCSPRNTRPEAPPPALPLGPTPPRPSAVPAGYSRVETVGVVRRSPSPQPFAAAIRECEARGATLLVIDSKAKLKYVNDFLALPQTFKGASNDRDLWVGVQVNGGVWRTLQGLDLAEIQGFKWYELRPLDGQCAVFSRDVQAHWDSKMCTDKAFKLPYICEVLPA